MVKPQCFMLQAMKSWPVGTKFLRGRVGPRRCARNGLQSVTFGKVHGLTWIISVTQERSIKRAQFNTENWLFWE
jgi:hypothetical protein